MTAETFVCPACEEEEFLDEVGRVVCDCGAVIDTYDDDRAAIAAEPGEAEASV